VNGDFWSCYSSTFDEFLDSDWAGLFPLMLEKKTIYIYGNHDRKEFMDERVNTFSVEQSSIKLLDIRSNTFHIEHGNLFFKHQSNSDPRYLRLIK